MSNNSTQDNKADNRETDRAQKKYFWTGLLVVAVIAIVIYILVPKKAQPESFTIHPDSSATSADSTAPGSTLGSTTATSSNAAAGQNVPSKVLLSVPFTSQAPLAQWSDPDFQNACEEASILMADHWITGESFGDANSETAEITAIINSEKQGGNYNYDLSAADTAKLFISYYNYPASKVSVINDPSADDIIAALAKGSIVIAPFNGQKLGNSHYSGAGPERHMMVIIGYDNSKQQFITNDPGTRVGQSYKYPYSTILGAMRDYVTGNEAPITSDRRAMIVISK